MKEPWAVLLAMLITEIRETARKAEQAWAEYNAATAAEGKTRKAQVTPASTVEEEASANAEKRRARLREVKPDPEPEVDPLERFHVALTEGLELLGKIATSTETIAEAHKPIIATEDPEQ